MLTFSSTRTLAIGEAMIEMAPVGEGLYRRGFAGDTFNTGWHMAQALPGTAQVGFATRVGSDSLSQEFVSELSEDGLDITAIGRDQDRTMGLYLIQLDGVERSFSYWRNDSAARRLADDPVWLSKVLSGAGLIHLSGITVAILSPEARANLIIALSEARAQGAVVSFDPNIRPKLWSSIDEVRRTIPEFLEVTDIALPSFDDEQVNWGDETVEATLLRFRAHGVPEIVVKNGAEPVSVMSDGDHHFVPTPTVSDILDTTGAGDAFNAGYLTARLLGHEPVDAVGRGQQMSGTVIQHFGARIPKEAIPTIV